MMKLIEEIREQWKPDNEYLWEEYDPESLIDIQECRQYTVNKLIYSRTKFYRALRAIDQDIQGRVRWSSRPLSLTSSPTCNSCSLKLCRTERNHPQRQNHLKGKEKVHEL